MWKGAVERVRPHTTIRRIRIYAGYLRLQTHTLKGCVVTIPFPLQRWMHERASVSLYMNRTLPVLLGFAAVQLEFPLFCYNTWLHSWNILPSDVVSFLGRTETLNVSNIFTVPLPPAPAHK